MSSSKIEKSLSDSVVTINRETLLSAQTKTGNVPDFTVNPLKSAIELFEKDILSIAIPDVNFTVSYVNGTAVSVPVSVAILRDLMQYSIAPDYPEYKYGHARRYDFPTLASETRPAIASSEPLSAWDTYKVYLEPLGATGIAKLDGKRSPVLHCKPNAELLEKLVSLKIEKLGVLVDDIGQFIGYTIKLPK